MIKDGMEKNIIKMVKLNLKVNILTIKNGMGKDMIQKVLFHMNLKMEKDIIIMMNYLMMKIQMKKQMEKLKNMIIMVD